MTNKLVLYTTWGHTWPVDVEAENLPVIVVSENGRYFAVSLIDGEVKRDNNGRYIYLEVFGHPVPPVTPL